MKKFKRRIKKSFITFKRELIETKQMITTIKNRDKKNYSQAKGQFVDILKFLFLFPVFILPGSVAVLTILELIARVFNTTIFPKKQKFKESK